MNAWVGTTVAAGREAGQAHELRHAVNEALEALSRRLVAHRGSTLREWEAAMQTPAVQSMQQAARFLGQVAAAWTQVTDEDVPSDRAGFGSTVVVEDLATDTPATYTLMTGALIDINDGQVSLASPIGQALRGAVAGDVVKVQTPHRLRTLRVLAVKTLRERLFGDPSTEPVSSAEEHECEATLST